MPELEVALGRAFPDLRQVRVVRAADLATVVRAAASYIDAVVRDGDLARPGAGRVLISDEATARELLRRNRGGHPHD